MSGRLSMRASGQPQCQLPPPGWRCSRWAGHPGPCAARREGWFTRHYTWRLPVWLCAIGFLVAALLDVACPGVDAEQIDAPHGRVRIVQPLVSMTSPVDGHYFTLGSDMAISVKVGGDLEKFLRAKVGRRTRVIIEDAE